MVTFGLLFNLEHAGEQNHGSQILHYGLARYWLSEILFYFYMSWCKSQPGLAQNFRAVRVAKLNFIQSPSALMIAHQHPASPVLWSPSPFQYQWGRNGMVPEGAPMAAEPKSLFLSGRLAAMLLNPSSAAPYNILVCPCLKLVLLWGFGPWVTWRWTVVSASRFIEFDKTSLQWVLQKSKSPLMCDSKQHKDPYLAFLYELAIIIHMRKIHLCLAINYYGSTVKPCDYFVFLLYALWLMSRAKCLFTNKCLLNHLQWVPSSLSTNKSWRHLISHFDMDIMQWLVFMHSFENAVLPLHWLIYREHWILLFIK